MEKHTACHLRGHFRKIILKYIQGKYNGTLSSASGGIERPILSKPGKLTRKMIFGRSFQITSNNMPQVCRAHENMERPWANDLQIDFIVPKTRLRQRLLFPSNALLRASFKLQNLKPFHPRPSGVRGLIRLFLCFGNIGDLKPFASGERAD